MTNNPAGSIVGYYVDKQRRVSRLRAEVSRQAVDHPLGLIKVLKRRKTVQRLEVHGVAEDESVAIHVRHVPISRLLGQPPRAAGRTAPSCRPAGR